MSIKPKKKLLRGIYAECVRMLLTKNAPTLHRDRLSSGAPVRAPNGRGLLMVTVTRLL